MKIYLAQINTKVGDISYNKKQILQEYEKSCNENCDLVVFPEMALSGYNARDLLLKNHFIENIERACQDIIDETRQKKCAIFFGTAFKEGLNLFNAGLLVENGEVKNIIKKKSLPNYGVFNEDRYFTPSKALSYIEFKGFTIAFLICEDLWNLQNQFLLKEQVFDLIISINSSPYSHIKHEKRQEIVDKLVKDKNKSLIYLNQVGGQDNLIFDGSSFIYDSVSGNKYYMKEFMQDSHILQIAKNGGVENISNIKNNLSDQIGRDYSAVILGIRDYVLKSGFEKVTLGLSGGIDSALAAIMAVDALGPENVSLYALPTRFNSQESLDDAKIIAKNLSVDLKVISIEKIFTAFENNFTDFNLSNLAKENLQSRIRGDILMSVSNSDNSLLLTTGNKSEMATGYATIYGDMCGAYNPLKDFYKTEIYNLARWRSNNNVEISLYKVLKIIHDNVIEKEPSAELRHNQKDSDSLPQYDILDEILYELIENRNSIANIVKKGFDSKLVIRIAKLLKNSEFKRKQSVIGAKVSRMSFDEDWSDPIANGFDENY